MRGGVYVGTISCFEKCFPNACIAGFLVGARRVREGNAEGAGSSGLRPRGSRHSGSASGI